MSAFGYCFRMWKKHVPLAVFCQIIGFIGLTIDLILPLISAMFVDYILDFDGEASGGIFSFLLKFGEPATWRLFAVLACSFAILVLIREGLIYTRNVLFQWNGLKFENELRDVTYKKLVDLDSSTVASYNTGELMSTLSSDVLTVREVFSRTLLLLFDGFYVLIVACVLLAMTNAYMLILPAVLAPGLIFALVNYTKAARKVSLNIRKEYAEMNLCVQENINAVRLVRSFANEDVEENKFDRINERLRAAFREQVDVSSKYGLIFNTLRQIAYIATIAIGTILAFNGMSVGVMTACVTYVQRIMDFLTQINTAVYQIQYGGVSASRIQEFLEKKSKIPESEKADVIHDLPNIQLKDVWVTEDGKNLLKNVNLEIPFGKKIGIMGGTGSGKSVLLKSLVRIYDVSRGSVTINGDDVRNIRLDDLRNEFAYVFQDVFLFSDTIDANIAFYQPETDKATVRRVAEFAQAEHFIRRLPQGYGTIVGERGLGLSGGQKQRISIARALLKNAPILVLDDASSALDVNTERRLMQSINENYPDRTILIAAHRVSSVQNCDEILYMQDGEIIERGTFDELIAQNGIFAQIWRMQSASEEQGESGDLSEAALTAVREDE